MICVDKDRKSGRVVAVWPGSSIHFMEMIANPRWEDFDIKYINVSKMICLVTMANRGQSNPFSFMGNGVSQREAKCEDLTYCKYRTFITTVLSLHIQTSMIWCRT